MNCVLKTVVVIALASWVAYGRSILQDTVESQDISGISAANEAVKSSPVTIDWPPKNPLTFRFAVVLFNTSVADATTAREIELGYQFWEYALNKRGGIPIGSKNVLVEVKFLYYNKSIDAAINSKRHQALLTAAIQQGEVDFILGGDTSLALDELAVSEQQQRITMLCCHGPPEVYQQAAEHNLDNMLFGIHVSSELYTNKLIRSIVVNEKAKRMALVVPNSSTFTRTAVSSTVRQLQGLKYSGTYSDFPYFEVLEIPDQYSSNLSYHQGIARKIKDENFDTVIAYTLDTDGKIFLQALQEEKPRLKAVFATVAPTNKVSVAQMTALGVRMEYVLSAGQWHVQCDFAEDPGIYNRTVGSKENRLDPVLWPSSSFFAESFENYTSAYKGASEPATYTHASAAAAAYAVQLAITAAFEGCQGIDSWDGSIESLLYTKSWNCGSNSLYSLAGTQQTGYQRVLRALRSLNRDTFFGKIYFSNDQRNVGRDAVTFQLLNQSDIHTDKFLDSVFFGLDALSTNASSATNTTGRQIRSLDSEASPRTVRLIQEVVLPSEYETRTLVLPRPPRDDDSDWCDGGYGLDANNNCQPCPTGGYRASFTGTPKAGDSFTCLKCNFTSYQENEGATECSPCPTFSETGLPGATSRMNCVCQAGYYNETLSPGVNCTYCPEGAICQGGLLPLIIEPGYWSSNLTATSAMAGRAEPGLLVGEVDVLPCNPQSACANNKTLNETCSPGWGGNLCSQCGYNNNGDDGTDYFLVFGSCIVCTKPGFNILIFLGVVLLWLIINLSMAEQLQSFALLIDWFQLLSLVGGINTAWPRSLRKLFSIAQLFAFEVDVVSLRCIDPNWDFFSDMILQFCLPLAIVGVYATYLFFKMCQRGQCTSKTSTKLMALSDGSESEIEQEVLSPPKSLLKYLLLKLGIILTFIKRSASKILRKCLGKQKTKHTSATNGSAYAPSFFDCVWRQSLNIAEITYLASVQYGFAALRTITVNGDTVLAKAPYKLQSTAILVVGSLGLAVYGVGFTLYLILQLWVLSPDCPFRKLPSGCRSKDEDPGGFIDKRHRTWLGWLYKDFRMEVYYMSAMHLIHRFLFAAVVTLAVSPKVQILSSIVLTTFFAILFYSKAPYYKNRLNVLQTTLYTSLFFQIGFALCFFPDSHWSNDWYGAIFYCNWAMILIVLGMLLWVIFMDSLEWLALRQSKAAIKKFLERKLRESEDSGAPPSYKDAHLLIGVFSPTRLWSWIKYETQKNNEAGLEDFITVVKDLAEYKTNDCWWLSMNDQAELWRSLVNKYPGIVAYIFNGSDVEVQCLYNFYVTFYTNYWNMQESWFGRWYNNLYKVNMKACWKRWVLYLTGKGDGAHLPQLGPSPMIRTAGTLVKDRIQTKDTGNNNTSCDERQEKNSYPISDLKRLDSSKDIGQRVENITWLLQSRDRPFIARWLAGIERRKKPRKHFKVLIQAIANMDTKHRCWEEKTMKILSLGMLALFHRQSEEARASNTTETPSIDTNFDNARDSIKDESTHS